MSINLHISFTYFENESRVLKETKTIAQSEIFDTVEIIAFGTEKHPQQEILDKNRKVTRIRLWKYARRKGPIGLFLRIIITSVNIVLLYRKKNIACVNPHSIFNLPAAVLLKKLTGCRLVYDAHELETERNGLSGIFKKIAKKTEAGLIRHVDHLIVVGDKIKLWYEKNYEIKNISVIYNYPLVSTKPAAPDLKKNYFRKKYNLSADKIIFIMQGLLDTGRSIDLLLNIFSALPADKHIVFMGYGPYELLIKEYETQYSNIHFHPAVAPSEVINYTSEADLGISLIENNCLSYYYSLPNKLFEYTISGIPSIVSDFPEMGNFIDTHQCGWKCNLDKQALTNLFTKINVENIKEKASNARIAASKITWQSQENRLINIYRNL